MALKLKSLRFGVLMGITGTLSAHAIASPLPSAYIVEAKSSAAAAQAVRRVGGRVSNELPIVNGVAAQLSLAQASRLRKMGAVTLFGDGPVATQSNSTVVPDIYQRSMMGVNQLASQGINGAGVLVAVLDSGTLQSSSALHLTEDLNGSNRMLAQYDAINNVLVDASHPCANAPCVNDTYGHGSHITSLLASSNTSDPILNGEPQGIAPMAKLIEVKSFDGNGIGTYATVLNGLNWIYSHRSTYGAIRVVNMSFGATPQSYY